MKYRRYEDETEESLIYRICSEKELIGTWEDVADVLNELLGYQNGESCYRKKFQSFKKILDANKSTFLEDDNYIKEIEQKERDLRKERIKLQTLNVERNRVNRAEARQELYYELVGATKDAIPTPSFKPIKLVDSEVDYLVAIADIHYGANFKSINNEYSIEECNRRFELLLSMLIEFVSKNDVRKLHILELGDTLQGILRVSDLKINETTVVKATVQASKLIAKFLSDLSKHCYIEYYHVPYANHTQNRPLGTKASELGDEDVEYVISHYIEDLVSENKRINVHLAVEGEKTIDFNLNGNEISAMHGHGVKNVNKVVGDLTMLKRKFIDYVIMGHLHGNKEFVSSEGVNNDTEVIICPSFIGSDPYSDSLMRGAKSSVKVYGFSKNGGVTETKKFVLN